MLKKSFCGLAWFKWVPLWFLIDFFTKHYIIQRMQLGQSLELRSWLNVTLAHNEGIAFSWLSHHPVVTRFVLIAFIVLICLSVALWLAQTPKEDVWSGCALGLILGGALGNLYDRILYGYVIDFIDIHYQHWHWFIFNVADSFISVGAAISVLAMLFCSEKRIRS